MVSTQKIIFISSRQRFVSKNISWSLASYRSLTNHIRFPFRTTLKWIEKNENFHFCRHITNKHFFFNNCRVRKTRQNFKRFSFVWLLLEKKSFEIERWKNNKRKVKNDGNINHKKCQMPLSEWMSEWEKQKANNSFSFIASIE